MVKLHFCKILSSFETYEAFCALKLAGFDNVEVVAVVALIDDLGTRLKRHLLHGAEYDLNLVWVQ